MILDIIGVILIILVVIFTASIIENIREKRSSKISFKEAMDLVELPVVTFYNGDKKLNFLLDTGSNKSIINKSVLVGLKHEVVDNYKECTFGMEGNVIENSVCKMVVYYKKNIFEEVFSIIDMDNSFNAIKQESGVQIHGILGSKFFERYKYILDFKELIAYIK